jgi:PPOX class probable F420-dependent enzyme
MAHLSTINADGSPQVTVVWIGLDGDDLVSGHMSWHVKLQNIERDPRVALSFDAPRVAGAFMNDYAVLRARAVIEPGDVAWHLLNRLTKVYVAPDAEAALAPGDRSLSKLSAAVLRLRVAKRSPRVSAGSMTSSISKAAIAGYCMRRREICQGMANISTRLRTP